MKVMKVGNNINRRKRGIMNITTTQDGYIKISDIVDNQLITRLYAFYTKNEAKRLFLSEINTKGKADINYEKE